MPFPNFHSARIKNPGLFSRIVTLQTLPNGIMILGGPLKSDPSGSGKPQAYRFPKSKFTSERARKWLADHNIKFISFEKASKTQSFIQKTVNLICKKIQALNQNEILALVPPKILYKIKLKDAHPFFQAFVICHEGISTPRILGEDAKPITWTRKAIQSIKNIITKGIKFFKGHNKDNSIAGRKVLGQVVASTQKEINGKLNHIVVSYHKPQVRDELNKYDICSQEAVWNFLETAGGYVADTIEKLTGIALDSSKHTKPAFAGAKRLGMVQAFDDKNKIIGDNKDMDLTTISWDELSGELKRRKTFPSQLYSLDEIRKDVSYKEIFDEIENLRNEVTKITEDNTALKENSKKLEKANLAASAKARLQTIMDSGTIILTDKQKDWINKFYRDDLADVTDEGLKTFINNQLENRKNSLEILNIQEDNLDIDTTNNSNTNKDDFTKADNNPLLEEDYITET